MANPPALETTLPDATAWRRRACLLVLGAAGLMLPAASRAETGNPADNRRLPSGQFITPDAVPGVSTMPLDPHLGLYPALVAGQAMSSAVSPDGKTLLVLTSGYNSIESPATHAFDEAASSEYVFAYDISGGRPVQTQTIRISTANAGIAFSADGRTFYAGTGGGDSVVAYKKAGYSWTEDGGPIALGHAHGVGLKQGPSTAGLAVTADGRTIVVANEFNDSVSSIDVAARTVSELDLRPGVEDAAFSGMAGGETPFWVVIDGRTAYVSSIRDREVDVLDMSGAAPRLATRIPVRGTPIKMLLDRKRHRLFVAADNDDGVQVIDTEADKVVARIPVAAPGTLLTRSPRYRGAAPNDLSLSEDGRTLYVSNGGENAIAVLDVTPGRVPHTMGLIPTGWYPNAVSVAHGWLYVSNSRSDPGPNPGNCDSSVARDTGKDRYFATCRANEYVLQREGASLQASPIPNGVVLEALTRRVAANDGFTDGHDARDRSVMTSLRQRIRHVIYIIKENRTYDQILGDLGTGNGDPALVEFGRAVTPNFHAMASQFVDLDNFEDSSEVSGNGWQWDLQARETDFNVKTIPLEYSRRKTNAPYDSEGDVRGVDVGLGSLGNRMRADPHYPDDANLLPGTNSDDIADGPGDDETSTQTGVLWDAALRRGLTVRNYGVEVTNTGRADDMDAFAHHDPQAICHAPGLIDLTDAYFRGFDQNQPDMVRYAEWHREFQHYEATGAMPSLELVRLSHDHMGKFATALAGVNTPELQQADDDYAVGRLVEDVSNGRFKDSTLIFVIEDDAQDGPDHVDAHRSTAYVVGPYVKQGAVVSQRYTTISLLRTIEDVLGIGHLSLFDAYQRPMTDVFDLSRAAWHFSATPSAYLYATTLPMPARHADAAPVPISTHPASWWAARTVGYDWSREDHAPVAAFNDLLWRGLGSSLSARRAD